MSLFNPCYEHCYLRLGKQYSSECDNKCEYAKAVKERDAAVRDLEDIMFMGRHNINSCEYCLIRTCREFGGHRLCSPKWRGPQQEV